MYTGAGCNKPIFTMTCRFFWYFPLRAQQGFFSRCTCTVLFIKNATHAERRKSLKLPQYSKCCKIKTQTLNVKTKTPLCSLLFGYILAQIFCNYMEVFCYKTVLRNRGVPTPLFTFESQFGNYYNCKMPCAINMQLTVSERVIHPLSRA